MPSLSPPFSLSLSIIVVCILVIPLLLSTTSVLKLAVLSRETERNLELFALIETGVAFGVFCSCLFASAINISAVS